VSGTVRQRPPWASKSVVYETWWHDEEHDCEERDCDAVIEVSASTVAAEAVQSMRRNPYAAYCRRRGCGHLSMLHEAAGCTAEGCDCEEMKE